MDSSHDLFIMQWILNLNACLEHLTFDCNEQVWAKHLDQPTRVVSFVTKDVHIQVVEIVKN